ncbi:MAG: hypothetical protein ACWA5L_02155 [bacterium]
MLKFSLVFLSFVMLIGCESMFAPRSYNEPFDTVSLQYDPYNFDMTELQKNADAACVAKGAAYAVKAGTSINREEVRWAYMNFDCYN